MRELLPSAVVMRPSIVFGPEDDFFNRFAADGPALAGAAADRRRRDPVPAGVRRRCRPGVSPAPSGTRPPPGGTYELGGPVVYTFKELMVLLLAEINRRRLLVPVPFSVARLMGMGGDVMAMLPLPLAPPITTDQVEMLRSHNVVSDGALRPRPPRRDRHRAGADPAHLPLPLPQGRPVRGRRPERRAATPSRLRRFRLPAPPRHNGRVGGSRRRSPTARSRAPASRRCGRRRTARTERRAAAPGPR